MLRFGKSLFFACLHCEALAETMKLLIVLALCVTATLAQRAGTRTPVDCGTGILGEHHVAVERNTVFPLGPTCDDICQDLNVWEHGGAGLIWDDSSRECTKAVKIYPGFMGNPSIQIDVPCDDSTAHTCCCKFVEECTPEEVDCGDGSTGNEPHFPVPRDTSSDPLCPDVCAGLDLSFHPESTSQSQGTGQCTKAMQIWSFPLLNQCLVYSYPSYNTGYANVCCCTFDI